MPFYCPALITIKPMMWVTANLWGFSNQLHINLLFFGLELSWILNKFSFHQLLCDTEFMGIKLARQFGPSIITMWSIEVVFNEVWCFDTSGRSICIGYGREWFGHHGRIWIRSCDTSRRASARSGCGQPLSCRIPARTTLLFSNKSIELRCGFIRSGPSTSCFLLLRRSFCWQARALPFCHFAERFQRL